MLQTVAALSGNPPRIMDACEALARAYRTKPRLSPMSPEAQAMRDSVMSALLQGMPLARAVAIAEGCLRRRRVPLRFLRAAPPPKRRRNPLTSSEAAWLLTTADRNLESIASQAKRARLEPMEIAARWYAAQKVAQYARDHSRAGGGVSRRAAELERRAGRLSPAVLGLMRSRSRSRSRRNPPEGPRSGGHVDISRVPGYRETLELYEEVHGREPTKFLSVRVDDGKPGLRRKVVVGFGKAPKRTHYSVPWPSRKHGRYYHDHDARPMWIVDPETRQLGLVSETHTIRDGWMDERGPL